MRYDIRFDHISDDELLGRLRSLLADSRRTECDLVAHIGEVDSRHLFAREAAPSMHAYCTGVLHLSEAEAHLRIQSARAARRFPAILEMLADGRVHLSAIALLAPHLTLENHAALLTRATHRTKRQVEELVAELAPRPDAPALVRKLPTRTTPAPTRPAGDSHVTPTVPSDGGSLSGSSDAGPLSVSTDADPEPSPNRMASGSTIPPPARVEVLAPQRYKVQFTASAAFLEKLERLQALLRSRIPDGDLAQVIEDAVTEKLERLEARRFGRTQRSRTDEVPEDNGSRYLSAALRRAVDSRDEGRCRFIDTQGRRCPERHRLEYHHRIPFGKGGGRTLDNICLMCHAHNQYQADLDYGRESMDRKRSTGKKTARTSGWLSRTDALPVSRVTSLPILEWVRT